MGAVSHHDARFAAPLEPLEMQATLENLLATFAITMTDLDVSFWIAHGTLLGWFWNEMLLPWDTDLDVQMQLSSLQKIAITSALRYFPSPISSIPTSYILDVNQFYSDGSLRDEANKIDARWIDTDNGKYIDITATRERDGSMYCKDGHHYEVWRMRDWLLSLTESDCRYVPNSASDHPWCSGTRTFLCSQGSSGRIWEKGAYQ